MAPLPFPSPLPSSVRVLEVGPRDGLQNQSRVIPVTLKAQWIQRLAASGIAEIESTSFVHPRWVPQLADGGELMALLLPQTPPPIYSALVPNLRGLENALAAGVENVAVFTAASETFCRKNINCSIQESIQRFEKIFRKLAETSVRVRGYISTCFGCPYEGDVQTDRVVEVARVLSGLGAVEIAISDTIGVATPPRVIEVVEKVAAILPRAQIALHLHDTYGLALSNVLAGLSAGITTYDASAGGIGGCPYAPGAAGNLATEDLIYLLSSLGVDTGIDLDLLIEANLWFETHFATPFPSRVLAARRAQAQMKRAGRGQG